MSQENIYKAILGLINWTRHILKTSVHHRACNYAFTHMVQPFYWLVSPFGGMQLPNMRVAALHLTAAARISRPSCRLATLCILRPGTQREACPGALSPQQSPYLPAEPQTPPLLVLGTPSCSLEHPSCMAGCLHKQEKQSHANLATGKPGRSLCTALTHPLASAPAEGNTPPGTQCQLQ